MFTFCCTQLFYRFAPTNVIHRTVFGLSVDTPPTCAKIPWVPTFLYHEVMCIYLSSVNHTLTGSKTVQTSTRILSLTFLSYFRAKR